jgi:streptogramin lyase
MKIVLRRGFFFHLIAFPFRLVTVGLLPTLALGCGSATLAGDGGTGGAVNPDASGAGGKPVGGTSGGGAGLGGTNGSGGVAGSAGDGGIGGKAGGGGTGGVAGQAGGGGAGEHGGMGGSGGAAGSGTAGSAGSGSSCSPLCASTAYCDSGACKSRISEFQIQTSRASPQFITKGPDGNLWFTDTYVGRITPSGTITEFDVVTLPDAPTGVTAQAVGITGGPDGNVWFTMLTSNGDACVAVVTPSGIVTDYIYSKTYSKLSGITSGPDGNLWFAVADDSNAQGDQGGDIIGVVTTTGTITTNTLVTPTSDPLGIVAGPDGNLWFTEAGSRSIGRITPAGSLTYFGVPNSTFSAPQRIAAGSDGNLWFTMGGPEIDQITTSGIITEFPIPSGTASTLDITKGPDGNMWFTELGVNNIGRIAVDGTVTEFPVPASPMGITTGPDGNIWFTEPSVGQIGRFLPPP